MKVLTRAYQISFPLIYKGLNYISSRVLGYSEYGRRYGLPEMLDKLHVPEPLITEIMARKVMELMVKPKAYEPKVVEFMLNQHGTLFVDIGACLGYYSFLLYNNFDEILALEPDPRNFKMLNEVKRIYHFHRVQALPLAVSNKTGLAKLYTSHQLPIHGESSLLKSGVRIKLPKGMVKVLKGGFIQVQTVALDSLLKPYPSIDLIKVDVEGAEWLVLEGAESILNKINSWIIELHDSRRRELEQWFSDRHYRHKWLSKYHIYAERS